MFDTILANQNLKSMFKNPTCFKSSNGSAVDLILTNNSYLYQKSQSFETGISDHHHLICTMLKIKYEQMPPKPSLIDLTKFLRKNSLKKLSDQIVLNIEGGNLTSLQRVIEKRLDQFDPMKKIVLRGNNKPNMTSQLRKAIMKRSRLKNKANKSGKPADKTAYKTKKFSR